MSFQSGSAASLASRTDLTPAQRKQPSGPTPLPSSVTGHSFSYAARTQSILILLELRLGIAIPLG